MYNWDHENGPLYGVAGCPLFRGLIIEVSGRTVGTFRIARYIVGVHFSGVSVRRGSTVVLMGIHNYIHRWLLWRPVYSVLRCGYATLHDVIDKSLEDRMESFFLSETCKYLYLVR